MPNATAFFEIHGKANQAPKALETLKQSVLLELYKQNRDDSECPYLMIGQIYERLGIERLTQKEHGLARADQLIHGVLVRLWVEKKATHPLSDSPNLVYPKGAWIITEKGIAAIEG